jgi:hypothetical protein
MADSDLRAPSTRLRRRLTKAHPDKIVGTGTVPQPRKLSHCSNPEIEELREAMHEFEENKGDWSKDR